MDETENRSLPFESKQKKRGLEIDEPLKSLWLSFTISVNQSFENIDNVI